MSMPVDQEYITTAFSTFKLMAIILYISYKVKIAYYIMHNVT